MSIPADAVIRVAVEKNPKRSGTAAHRHFQKFRDGMTVGEYLGLGPWAGAELRFSVKRGYVRIEGAAAAQPDQAAAEPTVVTT